MKRMICYRRVSTDDQADRGYSLPSQLEAIKAYAAAHDFEIVADFADDYSGATPIANRPEGAKAIAMLKRREADGIITHHVDRLSRDLVDALATVRDVTRAGQEVHTLDVGRIDAETDIVLVIKAWQGSDERKKIIERTSRGRNQKAKKGLVVGSGLSPYGYKYHAGQFIIDEQQARVVRMVYQWYVYGDETGRPLKFGGIRRKLLELGIQPARPNRSQSGEFGDETIRRILSSETYVGVWRFGKTIGRTGKKRAQEDQIVVYVPPIIDRALWEAAQVQRETNAKMSDRNRKHDYLLRGLIKCTCGRSLHGITNEDGKVYYRCGGRFKFTNDIRGCDFKVINAHIVERKVINWILRLIKNPETLEADLKAAQAAQLEAVEPKREQVENIVALIITANRELADNLAMMRSLAENSRRYKILKLEGDEIEARITELEARKVAIEAELQEQVIADADIRDIVQYSRDAKQGLDNPTIEDKRRWLEVLQVQVFLTSQTTAKATCILPAEPLIIESLTS